MKTDDLDPDDWEAFRGLCHAMLDEAIDHVRDVRDRPVWHPVPDTVKAALTTPMPTEGQGLEAVCGEFRDQVLPYATGNIHPRFFGWVHGTGTPGGILAELLTAAMNANVGGRDHGAVYVERQVVGWFRDLFGFPAAASGLLVSGTSIASLIALAVARNQHGEGAVRQDGLGRATMSLTAYTSAEAHNSVAKAFELLGLGRAALRAVPVDEAYRMDLDALDRAIQADRADGHRPFAVIGTAGTVNTGAIDDLAAIAEVARAQDLWFHVDGAFGALAALSPTLRPLLAGIEAAQSVAFDFHKWLHVPYDAACILIRDGDAHHAAFSSREEYLAAAPRGLAGGDPWYCEYGPELSRGFRALKVWFTLKEHGSARIGRTIEKNCQQASYLGELVDAHPKLERLAPIALNIVCFRYVVAGADGDTLNRLNQEIVMQLQEQGTAAPSTTTLAGRSAIRVNITNHRSRQDDFDLLADAVIAIGNGLSGES